MKALLPAVMLALAVVCPSVSAQSVAGEWDAAMSTPGGVISFKILFQVHGDTLTGTVRRDAGDVPLLGTVKGDTVSFTYTISYNGHDLPLSIVAIVVGDVMNGTVDFNGAGEDSFAAKRSPAPPKPAPF
jgi:hypothetical protein